MTLSYCLSDVEASCIDKCVYSSGHTQGTHLNVVGTYPQFVCTFPDALHSTALFIFTGVTYESVSSVASATLDAHVLAKKAFFLSTEKAGLSDFVFPTIAIQLDFVNPINRVLIKGLNLNDAIVTAFNGFGAKYLFLTVKENVFFYKNANGDFRGVPRHNVAWFKVDNTASSACGGTGLTAPIANFCTEADYIIGNPPAIPEETSSEFLTLTPDSQGLSVESSATPQNLVFDIAFKLSGSYVQDYSSVQYQGNTLLFSEKLRLRVEKNDLQATIPISDTNTKVNPVREVTAGGQSYDAQTTDATGFVCLNNAVGTSCPVRNYFCPYCQWVFHGLEKIGTEEYTLLKHSTQTSAYTVDNRLVISMLDSSNSVIDSVSISKTSELPKTSPKSNLRIEAITGFSTNSDISSIVGTANYLLKRTDGGGNTLLNIAAANVGTGCGQLGSKLSDLSAAVECAKSMGSCVDYNLRSLLNDQNAFKPFSQSDLWANLKNDVGSVIDSRTTIDASLNNIILKVKPSSSNVITASVQISLSAITFECPLDPEAQLIDTSYTLPNVHTCTQEAYILAPRSDWVTEPQKINHCSIWTNFVDSTGVRRVTVSLKNHGSASSYFFARLNCPSEMNSLESSGSSTGVTKSSKLLEA
eukprot:Nk52_evm1s354 gene=Nk52_evmTU1s354